MSRANEDFLHCPLCTFVTLDSYDLTLHVEEFHFADDSPFVAAEYRPVVGTREPSATLSDSVTSHDTVRGNAGLNSSLQSSTTAVNEYNEDEWVPCQEEDCGELVLWKDLSEHLYLHAVEVSDEIAILEESLEGSDTSQEKLILGRRTAIPHLQEKAPSVYPPPRRLGRDELGPYAYEKKMPRGLAEILSKDGRVTAVNRIGPDHKVQRHEFIENKIKNVIPALADMLDINPSTDTAQLCHPVVQHIFKLSNEGSFCGYRNVQMLISFIQNGPAVVALKSMTNPNILHIQDWIEQAWESGYDSHGKIETGGIKGTRKYIGTPEAKAMFDFLAIPNKVEYCFDQRLPNTSNNEKSPLQPAYHSIIKVVEAHFTSTPTHPSSKPNSKARVTTAAPIYLQLRGHSMTIIGLEKTNNPSSPMNLLVFDPSYGPPLAMRALLGLPSATRKSVVRKQPSSSIGRSTRTVWSWSEASTVSRQSKTEHVHRERDGPSRRGQPQSHVEQAARILQAYRRGPQRFVRHKECELLFVEIEGEDA